MLIPLNEGERKQVIPSLATGPQFKACWGAPQVFVQRLMISAIGGVISLLISQGVGLSSRWGTMWLVVGLVFLLTCLWAPIAIAARRNGALRRFPHAALAAAEVLDVYGEERVARRHEDVDAAGRLELVENRRRWLTLEVGDEDGYIGRIAFPLTKRHQGIRRGDRLCCLVLAERRDFARIAELSDGWLPDRNLWVGNYPYLQRQLFAELCRKRLRRWA